MDTTKLTAFAQAVGEDNKKVNEELKTKVSTSDMNQAISQAKSEVKAEILGEGVPENLDTLKEIAEKITSMSGDTEGAVVQKLADLGRRIDELANVDLVETYNAAKA